MPNWGSGQRSDATTRRDSPRSGARLPLGFRGGCNWCCVDVGDVVRSSTSDGLAAHLVEHVHSSRLVRAPIVDDRNDSAAVAWSAPRACNHRGWPARAVTAESGSAARHGLQCQKGGVQPQRGRTECGAEARRCQARDPQAPSITMCIRHRPIMVSSGGMPLRQERRSTARGNMPLLLEANRKLANWQPFAITFDYIDAFAANASELVGATKY